MLLASDETDIGTALVPTSLIQLDAGSSIIILARGHSSCLELFGSERVSHSVTCREKLLPSSTYKLVLWVSLPTWQRT